MSMDAVLKRALKRFDDTVTAQQEMRAKALQARRFVNIPGAQWEDHWQQDTENIPKLEINKIGKGVQKILTDYAENRIEPDFRPDGDASDQDTANMLDGLLRADAYRFNAPQARDSAFIDAVEGGFGAYRLATVDEDEYDPDNKRRRINPGIIIPDADQKVFFDMNSVSQDKSDARFCIVLCQYSRDAFEEEYPDAQSQWPEATDRVSTYDWFQPDTVLVAEYYECEVVDDTLVKLEQPTTEIKEQFWRDQIDDEEIEDKKLAGWVVTEQKRKRKRVHKYVMTAAEILEDEGYIAGEYIPIVPVYGKRKFVDKMERFKGHVQDRIDAQRLYNSSVSHVALQRSISPISKPIFAAEQIPPGNLQDIWARAHIDNLPYLVVNPLLDPNTGNIVSVGPIGQINPPDVSPADAALIQIAGNDLVEDDQDGADEVKANTSAEAMELAAARVDAKSGVYLDNMRQAVKREAEIYLSMARDVYCEPGREVEIMTEDGDDGKVKLYETISEGGTLKMRHDLMRGKYKVICSVSEATATRRDKTIKASFNLAEVAVNVGDTELAQAALLTAVSNMDGEGIDDLLDFARKKGLDSGLFKPNEEEQRAIDEAQQNAQPDMTAQVLEAQSNDLNASAQLKQAQTAKAMADTKLSEAKTIETMASAGEKGAKVLSIQDAIENPKILKGREAS